MSSLITHTVALKSLFYGRPYFFLRILLFLASSPLVSVALSSLLNSVFSNSRNFLCYIFLAFVVSSLSLFLKNLTALSTFFSSTTNSSSAKDMTCELA